MGIYISNLILPPDDKQDLVICIQHDGTVLDPWGNLINTKAVEVPPHGALKAADALRCYWLDAEESIGGDKKLDGLTIHDVITEGCVFDLDNAETIIPAVPPDPAENDDTARYTKCKSGRSPLCKYCPGDSGADPAEE